MNERSRSAQGRLADRRPVAPTDSPTSAGRLRREANGRQTRPETLRRPPNGRGAREIDIDSRVENRTTRIENPSSAPFTLAGVLDMARPPPLPYPHVQILKYFCHHQIQHWCSRRFRSACVVISHPCLARSGVRNLCTVVLCASLVTPDARARAQTRTHLSPPER